MTLTTTTNRADFVGTGITGPYAFTFPIVTNADLVVTTRNTTTDIETTLTLTTDYTVTGAGDADGGSITLTTALATGRTLTIRRVRPLTQATSLRSQGTTFPATLEDVCDNLTMIAQQQQDDLDRSMTLPITIDPDDVSVRLPVPEAGKALVWTSAADGLENRALDNSTIALPGDSRTVATVSDYLDNNKVFNVKDYGAVGDGVTDDTDAIQAAITAADLSVTIDGSAGLLRRIVRIPDGVYHCESALTIKYASAIRGDSPGAVLDFTDFASGTAIQAGSAASQPHPAGEAAWLDNLTILGPGIDTTVVGIQFGGTGVQYSGAVIARVVVDGFGTGMKAGSNFFLARFAGCRVRHCGVGYEDVGAHTLAGENLSFDHCTFSRNRQHISISPGSGGGVSYAFTACSFDYAAHTDETTADLAIASADHFRFTSCHFENDRDGSTGDPYWVEMAFHGRALTFEHCDFIFAATPDADIVGVQWTSGAAASGMGVVFNNCFTNNTLTTFYGANATGAGTQPVAVLIHSPSITTTDGKALRIGQLDADGTVGIAMPGDVAATGGYRQTLFGWNQATTVAASQAAVALTDAVASSGRSMPRAGSVTGLAVRLSSAWTAGTLTIVVQQSTDNGGTWTTIADCEVVIDSAVTDAQATFDKDTFAFAAGDMLRVAITTDASWTPTANDVDVAMEVET